MKLPRMSAEDAKALALEAISREEPPPSYMLEVLNGHRCALGHDFTDYTKNVLAAMRNYMFDLLDQEGVPYTIHKRKRHSFIEWGGPVCVWCLSRKPEKGQMVCFLCQEK